MTYPDNRSRSPWADVVLFGAYIAGGLALGSFGAMAVRLGLPLLATSLSGAEAKGFWYISRAAGLVAYGLLWLSMVLGLSVTGRVAKQWKAGAAAVDLHEFTTLSAIVLALVHGLVLLGDQYIKFTPLTLSVPFLSDYRPVWVALGQIGMYLGIPLAASFYLRKRIGQRTWRLLHYATFGMFTLVTAHGLGAGTDASNPAILGMYGIATVSVYALTVYRILSTTKKPQAVTARAR